MNSYELAKKQYNLLYDIDYTLIDYVPDKPFNRESPVFSLDEGQIIDERPTYFQNGPMYFQNGEKIINLIEYWQHFICVKLNSDIKWMGLDKGNALVCSTIQPGYFYSNYFPFVGWRIITEDIFVKITGTIWIK